MMIMARLNAKNSVWIWIDNAEECTSDGGKVDSKIIILGED